MHFRFGLFCLLTVVVLYGCTQDDYYAKKAKTLDSLGGAINAAVSNLQKTDTVALLKALNCYSDYKLFIRQKVGDTLSKTEADLLLIFFENGEHLQSYKANKLNLMARAALVNSQILRLSDDAKKATLHRDLLGKYVELEMIETAKMIAGISAQHQMYFESLEAFRSVVPGVENVIRSRNSGQLPTIVKDVDRANYGNNISE